MVYETKYYNILGVAPNASQDEMRKGFRKLAMIYHPDRNPAGAQKFAEISTVYDVLSDETLRQIYDLTGEKGISQFTNAQSCCGGCSGELGHCGGGGYDDSDEEDYDDSDEEDYDSDEDEEHEDGREPGEVVAPKPTTGAEEKTPEVPPTANEHNSMKKAISGEEYLKRQMTLRQMQDKGMTNQAGMMGVMGFSGVNNMAMAGVMSQMAGHSHAHGAAGHSHAHGAAGHSHDHGAAGHSHSHGPGHSHSHDHGAAGHSHSHGPGHSHSHGPSHSHPNPLLNNSKSQGNGTMAPPSAPGLTITAVPKTQVANKGRRKIFFPLLFDQLMKFV